MEVWQYPIAAIAGILTAVFVGISSAYLSIRFVRKDDKFQFLNLFYLLFRKNPEILPSSDRLQQSKNGPSMHGKSHDLTELFSPELVFELECNSRNAAHFPTGNRMLPLQTDVWDTQKESTQELPTYLRSELEQVYADIKTLNKLVWFSAELGYQGYSLADYRKLLSRIAHRTKKIKSVAALVFPE